MITRIFTRDLSTIGCVGAPRKEWIMAAASLAGGIASSLFGGAKARKARKRAAREREYRANAEKAWYDKAYNTDYLDTKAGQNLLRKASEVQNEYIRKADGAAAVGGSTAASVAQAKEAANRTMGNTIANIAASDTSRKQSVEDAHHNNLMQQSKERESAALEQAQQDTTAAQNMSNTLMTAAGSLAGGDNKQGINKLGSGAGVNGNTFGEKMPVSASVGTYHATDAQDAVSSLDKTIRLRNATGV